mmetsp:Transcript_19721/g.25395  ORF Transcript_19721/g.25395 Transcript_19721/m.25395 type:complete len:92 (+) Transcript_19721:63-338(+)
MDNSNFTKGYPCSGHEQNHIINDTGIDDHDKTLFNLIDDLSPATWWQSETEQEDVVYEAVPAAVYSHNLSSHYGHGILQVGGSDPVILLQR